jgi:hypothetical protein
MLSLYGWGLDTCGCYVHVAYDTDNPAETSRFVTWEEAKAIHAARKASSKLSPAVLCPAHAHLGHTVERFDVVRAENKLKNEALDLAVKHQLGIGRGGDVQKALADKVAKKLNVASLDELPGMEELVTNAVGKLYAEVEWEFGSDRRLTLKTKGTGQERGHLKAALAAEFGPDKVDVKEKHPSASG